jgi:hypothetical protein
MEWLQETKHTKATLRARERHETAQHKIYFLVRAIQPCFLPDAVLCLMLAYLTTAEVIACL